MQFEEIISFLLVPALPPYGPSHQNKLFINFHKTIKIKNTGHIGTVMKKKSFFAASLISVIPFKYVSFF